MQALFSRVVLLSVPFVLGVLPLSVTRAWAQAQPGPSPASSAEPSAPATELAPVVITGRALSAKKAIAEKRAERVVSDGVSSDEIGSIPDFGLGEALQRVPGVSMIVNNGRGEAQFMTLRGFNPDYNSVTIDGIALPATETTRRVVSLDVIPASLASQVSVYKTFTPEMEGNAIGGLTNLRTRSAFDNPGQHFSLRTDLSDWTNHRRLDRSSPSGQLEGTMSTTFGEHNEFGALLSGSYFRRVSSSLNTAIDSYSFYPKGGAQTNAAKLNPATADVSNAIAFPDRLRWLTYDNIRERKSLFGKLEYDNHSNFRAHLTGGWFQHLNDEDRRAQWLQNTATASSPVTVNGLTGSAASGQSQTDYAKFDQNRQLRYVEAGAEYQPWDRGLIDVTYNEASGSYRQDSKLHTFATGNSTALGYDYTLVPGSVPVFTPRNGSALYDTSRYNLTENTSQVEQSTTHQHTLKVNLSHNLEDGAQGWGFKTGFQLRDLTKNYNFDEQRFNPATGRPITLAQVGASSAMVVPYNSNGRSLLLVDPALAQAYFNANPGRYTLSPDQVARSTSQDFDVSERISAAYGMAAYQLENFTATAGARVEHAATRIDTWMPTPLNQSTTYGQTSQSSSRTDVLPSVNLSWDIHPDLRLRTGLGRSLARPIYSDLGQNSSSVAGNIITTTQANPDLQPRKSRNLDVSLEWHPSLDSMVSVALFDKNISNEIARLTSTNNLMIGGASYTQNLTQASNVGTAKVNGLELGATDVHFDFLPAPFNAFGGAANFTLMDQKPASVRMSNGTSRAMPQMQDSPTRMANLALLWGSGAWSGQVAYNYTGKTLTSLSTTNSALDIYYAAIKTVDMQVRYQYSKALSFALQAKNLTGAKLRRVTGPGQSLLNQEIDNGKSYWFGMTYAL
ncbi:TonB-dependent receptor [Variovorax sp. YR266]|uniref:TonB-dependent receptor n=1 Tax=Variovorax sp. YR266 TaxID=1884386 RepID=UPI00089BF4E0|nr:TonB-dependent receptor [Variovorax sp. YR266]SDZ70422.1 TonB-dependent receptor [Variovorax sp. YR266]